MSNRNVLFTVENLDPELFWLTNYAETILMHTWSPSTVATGSRNSKNIILNALIKSGDPAGLPFKLHDFGFRGVSSVETAALAGAAHLVNFMGTDTLAALDLVLQYYCGYSPNEIKNMNNEQYASFVKTNMPGFSIPASEHSTITTWGENGEIDAFRNILDAYPTGLVACVSDSWDIDRACSGLWPSLKKNIEKRDGILIIRPDSGEPTEIVPRILDHLYKNIGGEVNEKGYKVLHPKIRIIQGDGIDHDTIGDILEAVMDERFSIDNIAFGSGGGLLQKVNRDTQCMAMKCSHAVINDENIDVFKRPATDPAKNSKKGRFAIVKDGNRLITVPEANAENYKGGNQLVEVFRDGKMVKEWTFQEVRDRAELPQMQNA